MPLNASPTGAYSGDEGALPTSAPIEYNIQEAQRILPVPQTSCRSTSAYAFPTSFLRLHKGKRSIHPPPAPLSLTFTAPLRCRGSILRFRHSPSDHALLYSHHTLRPRTPATRNPPTIKRIQWRPIQKMSRASLPCQLEPPCHLKNDHGIRLYSSGINTRTRPSSRPSHRPTPLAAGAFPASPGISVTERPRPRLYSCQITLRNRGPVEPITVM